MKNLLWSLCFTLPLLVLSQTFDWAKGFGGWVNDMPHAMATDTQGNIYLTGYVSGGTIGNITIEEQGAFVVKFDDQGNMVWVRRFGGFDTRSTDIKVDDDGYVYLTGFYGYPFTFDNVSVPNGLPNAMFLMKLDQIGGLIMLKTYEDWDSYGHTIANALELDEDGNIYVAGLIESELYLGDTTYFGGSSAYPDMLLIKFSPEGEIIYLRNPGGSSYDYLFDISITSSGIYGVGKSGNQEIKFGSHTHKTGKSGQALLFHYTLDGEYKWAKSFDTYNSDGFDVTSNDKKEAIILGFWNTENLHTEQNLFIAKVDSLGETLYHHVVQRHDYFLSSGKSPGKPGGLFVSGDDLLMASSIQWASDYGPSSFNGSDSREIAVHKFNEIGYPQWFFHTTNEVHDYGSMITSYGDNIYISGRFTSEILTIGDTSLSNNGPINSSDIFLSKFIDTPTHLCPDNNFTLSHESSFCDKDSLLVSINHPYAVYTKWYKDGQPIPFNNKKKVYLKEPGIYEVEINKNTSCPGPTLSLYIDQEGNTSQDTDVILYTLPMFSIEGEGGLFCQRDTMILNSEFNSSFLYDWVVPSGFSHSDNNLNGIKIEMTNPTTTHEYVLLEVTDNTTGCKARDSIFFEVEKSAEALIYKPSGICEGEQIYVRAKQGINYQYTWEVPEFFPSLSKTGFFIQFEVTDEMDGAKLVVNVTESGSNCISKDSVYLVVNPAFHVDVEKDGDSLKVISDEVVYVSWYLDNLLLPSPPNPTSLFIEKPGEYMVTAINKNGCVARVVIPETTILDIDEIPDHISLYPNPSSNIVKINSNKIPIKINVFDQSGKLLLTQKETKEVDLSGFDLGIYILGLDFGTYVQNFKIIRN